MSFSQNLFPRIYDLSKFNHNFFYDPMCPFLIKKCQFFSSQITFHLFISFLSIPINSILFHLQTDLLIYIISLRISILQKDAENSREMYVISEKASNVECHCQVNKQKYFLQIFADTSYPNKMKIMKNNGNNTISCVREERKNNKESRINERRTGGVMCTCHVVFNELFN